MELHELEILQRQPGAKRHRHAVGGAGEGVGRAPEDAPGAAGRQHDSLGRDRLQPAGPKIPGQNAAGTFLGQHQPPGKELLVDLDPALEQLFIKELKQHVAGHVGRVDRPRRPGAAEGTLRQPALVGTVKEGAPALELVDVARRLVAEQLDRVLVAEVVGALDGVGGVLLRTVGAGVSERRVHSAAGRAGVAAGGMQLGDERHLGARVVGFDRGAHARAAGAYHQYVVRGLHVRWTVHNRERVILRLARFSRAGGAPGEAGSPPPVPNLEPNEKTHTCLCRNRVNLSNGAFGDPTSEKARPDAPWLVNRRLNARRLRRLNN